LLNSKINLAYFGADEMDQSLICAVIVLSTYEINSRIAECLIRGKI